MPHALWPLFDLVITTPRLEVRLPTDDELALLAPHANDSIFTNSASMPFVLNWPFLPSPDREISLYQWHTSLRATWKPQAWNLSLVGFLDGQPIGNQAMEARNFGKLKTVETGSYIAAPWQRQGFGTEIRAATLELAFAELGAIEAHSAARIDNQASSGVSRKLGYVENGQRNTMFGDEAGRKTLLLLTRANWMANRMPGVSISGIDRCRAYFGGNGESWQTA